MSKRIKIDDINWVFFKGKIDPDIKRPFQRGDIVVKCASCSRLFIEQLIDNGKCPYCYKHMEYAEISLKSRHLDLVKKHRSVKERTHRSVKICFGKVLFGVALTEFILALALFVLVSKWLYPNGIDLLNNPILQQIGSLFPTAFHVVKEFVLTVFELIKSLFN